MAKVITTIGYGDTERDVEVEIPDDLIARASAAAYDEDRMMVVGEHPVFGWIYKDAEDTAGIAEIGQTWRVSGAGLEDV